MRIEFLSLLAVVLVSGEVLACQANWTERPYLHNLENITSVDDLGDFIDAQTIIYIDNVYGQYRRFFNSLIAVLPKSKRREFITEVVHEVGEFVDQTDADKKLMMFHKFADKQSVSFEEIFEYDDADTGLEAKDFHQLFVDNEVYELLTYANDGQLSEFTEATGNGIRLFLLQLRSQLRQPQVWLLQMIVEEFVENPDFTAKLACLQVLLEQIREYTAS